MSESLTATASSARCCSIPTSATPSCGPGWCAEDRVRAAVHVRAATAGEGAAGSAQGRAAPRLGAGRLLRAAGAHQRPRGLRPDVGRGVLAHARSNEGLGGAGPALGRRPGRVVRDHPARFPVPGEHHVGGRCAPARQLRRQPDPAGVGGRVLDPTARAAAWNRSPTIFGESGTTRSSGGRRRFSGQMRVFSVFSVK